MKKNVLFVLAALCFAACSREMAAPVAPETVTGKRVTLTASAPETKVAVKDGAYIWQEGDQIGVFLSDGSIVKFTADEITEDGTHAVFSAVIPGDKTLGSYALMPYDENQYYSISESSADITLLDQYPWTGKTNWAENKINMPMIGEIDGTSVLFTAAGGAIRFPVKNIPVGSVRFVFEAASDQIAGIISADLSKKTVDVVPGTPFDKSVSIDFSGSYAVDKTFIIPVPKGEINGFSLKMLDKNDAVLSSVTSSHKISVDANQIITAPAVSFEAFKGLVGKWTFEQESIAAEVGNDGDVFGTDYSYGLVDGVADRYIHLGKQTYLSLPHGLKDGADEFTIMTYIRFPERPSDNKTAYYNLFEQNDSRYGIFQFAVNGLSGGLRFEFPGLCSLASNENRYYMDYGIWYKIYLVVKNGLFNIYIEDFPGVAENGSFSAQLHSGFAANFNTMKSGTGQNLNTGENAGIERYLIHGDRTLVTKALGNYDMPVDIAEMAVWNKALTVEEMYGYEGISKVNYSVYKTSEGSKEPNSLNLVSYVGTPWYCPQASLPAYWILDLKEPKDVEKITWYVARWGAAQPLSTKIYVSNTPDNDNSWVEVSSYKRSNGNYTVGSLYTFNFPGLTEKYRYVKGYYPDVFGSNVTCLQLHVYEKL